MSTNDKVSLIQKLRDESGAGVMDCKRALDEAGGDFEKAMQLIRERGLAKAGKRADRETGAGLVISYVHNERIGAILDVRAETDFVVRSEPFRELAKELVMHIAAAGPETVEELIEQPYIKDESRKIGDLISDVIARVGENVRVNKFYRIAI